MLQKAIDEGFIDLTAYMHHTPLERQRAHRPDSRREQRQDIERGLIGPVQILEHQDGRAMTAQLV